MGAVQAIDYIQYFLFSTYSSNLASNLLKLKGRYFKVIAPFYHKDLLQQVRLMGLHERTKATIQDYIIKKNSNYLSKLPYYNSNRKLKYFKLICNKLSNRIINRDVFKNPYLVNYSFWLRKYHKGFVLDTLNYKKMKSKELFNEIELNKLTNRFIENKTSLRNKKRYCLTLHWINL